MAILTVAQLKEHIPGLTLADAAIQRLLDAAETSILAEAGVSGSVTELHHGGGSTVWLNRRAASLTSVTEGVDTSSPLELDESDYRLSADGTEVRRLALGDNPAAGFAPRVQVVMTAADDAANRKRAQVALVKLDLGYSGFEAENAPAFSRPPAYYEERRREILDSLRPAGALFA